MPTEVTTSGVDGDALISIKDNLKSHGLEWRETLTRRTKVVVAGSTMSQKYVAARAKGIPCVDPAWVHRGACSLAELSRFIVHREIRGMQICTTGLSPDQRLRVRSLCEAHAAVYRSQLTKKCGLLVVSFPVLVSNTMTAIKEGEFAAPVNDKVAFAMQNNISMILLRDFCTCFSDRAGRECETEPPVEVQHTVSQSPEHDEVSHAAWLPGIFHPVITFTALSSYQRKVIISAVEKAGLKYTVQDNLVLGGPSRGDVSAKDTSSGTPHLTTTHLVVPRAAMFLSKKVAALCSRFAKTKRIECSLVAAEWLIRSAKASVWLDCAPYCLPIPLLCEFASAVMNPKSAAATPSIPNTVTTANGAMTGDATCAVRPAASSVVLTSKAARDSSDVYEEGGVTRSFTPRKRLRGMESLEDSRKHCLSGAELTPSLTLEALLGELEASHCPSDSSTVAFHSLGHIKPQQSGINAHLADHGLPVTDADVRQNSKLISAKALVLKPITSPHALSSPHKDLESQVVMYCRESADGEANACASVVSTSRSRKPSSLDYPTPLRSNSSTDGVFCFLISKDIQNAVDIDSFFAALPICQRVGTPEECTHMITSKPSKTEQFLCCLAAGKWILTPAFLQESLEAGSIVPESPYEWSVEQATSLGCRYSVAALVRGCALQRSLKGKRFSAWQVVLCCSSSARCNSFSHVLRCGGCPLVLSVVSPQKVLEIFDRCEVERDAVVVSDDGMWSAELLEKLGQGVRGAGTVLRLEYLVHCLCVPDAAPAGFIVNPVPRVPKESAE